MKTLMLFVFCLPLLTFSMDQQSHPSREGGNWQEQHRKDLAQFEQDLERRLKDVDSTQHTYRFSPNLEMEEDGIFRQFLAENGDKLPFLKLKSPESFTKWDGESALEFTISPLELTQWLMLQVELNHTLGPKHDPDTFKKLLEDFLKGISAKKNSFPDLIKYIAEAFYPHHKKTCMCARKKRGETTANTFPQTFSPLYSYLMKNGSKL